MTPASAHLLPGWRWLPGMLALRPDSDLRVRVFHVVDGVPSMVVVSDDDVERGPWFVDVSRGWPPEAVPDWSDPATGGCCMELLGTQAWAVKYSPSAHKQAAGTPWIGDLGATGLALHASLGLACAAVAVSLGTWPGTPAEESTP